MTIQQAAGVRSEARIAGARATGNRAVLELRVGELRQMFNAMDPAPFRERDLDPAAVAYILDWGREAPNREPLRLVVQLGREPATAENSGMLRDAVHAYFRHRALATRRQLRQLFRVGRVSLVIAGWVALWRPLEIFLYDWWPIRAEARLHDRLSEMDVRLVGADRMAGPAS